MADRQTCIGCALSFNNREIHVHNGSINVNKIREVIFTTKPSKSCWWHRGPGTNKEALKELGMLITLVCFLNGGQTTKIKYLHYIQKADNGYSCPFP